VAGHASARRGVGHQLAGIGICGTSGTGA
jgi:hypothetical protein